MDPTVVPPLSHRDLQPELDRKRSSSSTVRKDSRIVSEYREDTWYSDKDSLDLVVGLSIDSLVAGRRVSSRRLSWARSRDLLGYRSGLCSSALHLGLLEAGLSPGPDKPAQEDNPQAVEDIRSRYHQQ